MKHTFWLLLLLPAAAAAGEKAKGDEIRTDRLNYFLNAAFGRYGAGPGRGLLMERSGVRMRLAGAPKDSTQVGAYSHFSLAGDFEVSAAYEVLSLGKPSTGYGASFGFAVHTQGRAGSVMVCRSCGSDGVEAVGVTRELPKEGGGFDYEAQSFPTRAKKGRLAIRRSGDRVTVLAAEKAAVPAPLASFTFSTDPVYQVRVYADGGGDPVTVDGRLSDLHIRADHINGAATPPDAGWSWTTWLLLASCGLLAVGGGLVVRRRWAGRADAGEE
ncbi:MAG: hypothetical protein U0840_29655 [Gemmataceae bacterium]